MEGIALLLKYFPGLNKHQQQQFQQLGSLYREWNEKINVISRKDMDHLYLHHVLHSLSLAKVIDFKPNTHILDIGTGGGFPGIPLAIYFPQCNFHLVDSIGKKIKVVNAVYEAVGLENVSSEQNRAEKLQGKYDFVTGRAITNLNSIINWTRSKINNDSRNNLKNGIFYLKGGDFAEEINQIKRPYKIFNIADYFEEEFFKTKKIIQIPL